MNVQIPCRFVETKRKYENHFTIAIFKTSKKNIPEEFLDKNERRRKITVSVKGYDIPTPKEYDVLINGDFKVEPVYGYTIVVNSAQIIQPTDVEGIQQYLIDFVDGIGPKVAQKMTETFGDETLKVLENNPERLSEVPRLRKSSIDKILVSYEKTKGNSELIKLLTPFGITSKTAMDIKMFFQKRDRKVSAVKQLKENPFVLSEINGLSFDTLDAISSRFNCDPAHKDRIVACIIDELKMVQTNGHLYLPQRRLLDSVLKRLNDGFYQQVVYYDDVKQVMFDMARIGRLCGDYGNAYLPGNYYFEKKSAEMINGFLNAKSNDNMQTDAFITLVERKFGIELAPKQAEAVKMAVNNQLSIIVGCAGTGKTTVLKAILQVLYKRGYKPEDIVLAAPTGKAAQRMAEATGHHANTIHSTLGLKADIDDKPEDIEALDAKMLIIDEFSMTDMYVTYRILSAVNPEKTKLLFLGDTAQLPSVGAGNVLHELVRSCKVPYTKLDVIYRQSFDNVIIKNASNIRYGIRSVITNDNFKIIEEPSPQQAVDTITRLYLQAINDHGFENVVVLSPLKKKGVCATNALNKTLQEAVNPPSSDKAEHKVGKNLFRVNDRVMQNKNITVLDSKSNEVQICNGDTGYIKSISKSDGGYTFCIDFGFGRLVDFSFEDMFNVELAYAVTIHKSQGSQYTDVIIPMLDYFDNMLYRNLLYTGVTRATENVTIVGSRDCVYRCIDNNRIVRRNTNLGNRIKNLQKEEVS